MILKLLLICIILCSCTATRLTETDLYFGQSKPGGGMVSESEWKNFKENHIARVFKEGSTIIDGTGSWHDLTTRKLISEPVYVVIYFYKKSKQKSLEIDSLRNWYKNTFRQQSILRVDKKVKAEF